MRIFESKFMRIHADHNRNDALNKQISEVIIYRYIHYLFKVMCTVLLLHRI
jgi:hypothetical protein